MSDNIKILKNYLIYFLLMILVCVVGITNVFALTDEYNNIGYIDNNTYVEISVSYTTSKLPLTILHEYQLADVLEMYIELDNFTFNGGTTYSIEFYTSLGSLYTTNSFGVLGTTSSGEPIICDTAGIDYDDVQHLNFRFNCSKSVTNVKINIFNSSGGYIMQDGLFKWNYAYLRELVKGDNTSILESQNAQIIQGQQDIINNQNENTQDIIDNNNQNTQDIIDNQNTNNQAILDDNKKNFQTCRDSYNLFNTSDTMWSGSSVGKVNYSSIDDTFTFHRDSGGDYLIRYGSLNLKPSTNYFLYFDVIENTMTQSFRIINPSFLSNGSSMTLIPANETGVFTFNFTSRDTAVTYDIWFYANSTGTLKTKIMLVEGNSSYSYEPYGVEICKNKLDEQTNAINGLNDTLNNDDTSGATSEASDFFNSFTTNTFGLTSIITAPLNLIQSLTSSTCSQLHLPLPYLDNKYLDLPCMTSIYQTHFGAFFTMYQTITYGIIAYWVCVRIFNQVKDFKNPEHDEIEVVDL